MKTMAAITVALWVAGTTLTAQAGRDDNRHLALCEAEVNAVMGADSSSKLIGIKRRRGPDELRIKVVPAHGNSLLVSCSVIEDRVQLLDRDGVALNLGDAGGEALSASH